jgi:hypothetical protein
MQKERSKLGRINIRHSARFDFLWRFPISTAEPAANRQRRCLSVQQVCCNSYLI